MSVLNVAFVGVGLVGSEVISQLLSLSHPNPFRIVAISRSKSTLFTPSGLSISPGWKSELAKATQKTDFSELKLRLKALDRVVLVDNTASDEVAKLYPTFLDSGIAVVTPNKKAFSGDLDLYEQILAASARTNAKFLNESTVGAGLPIVSTLKDLIATGDKVNLSVFFCSSSLFSPKRKCVQVNKIEGVFSGTMSYIFNEFSNGQPTGPSFSSVVSTAREKGYTVSLLHHPYSRSHLSYTYHDHTKEPHPADDLNGADVARKLTILSRIIPSLRTLLPAGYRSVDTTSLVPAELSDVPTGDAFLARLSDFDAHFDRMRSEAAQEGMVLRYVGVVDARTREVKASLEKYVLLPYEWSYNYLRGDSKKRYPKTHPFATSLGGSDNIIMFHTDRYGTRPLIVQGAGAGAAVTAMGVMSDLLKLV